MEDGNNKFIHNYGYDKYVVEEVKEKLGKIKEFGYFMGTNNVNIYYEKYCIEKEKGAIVICHGFSECINKFTEMIYYFLEMGYSVYAIEHRGHGRSGSLSKTDKSQVNIDKFENYVEDLKSTDLANWRTINYAYSTLTNSNAMNLNANANAYGKDRKSVV